MAVANTWFKKDIGRLITYESGRNKTAVDYILIKKVERKLVWNVNVIPGDACLHVKPEGECEKEEGDICE